MFAVSAVIVSLASLVMFMIINILLTLIKQYRVNKFFQLKSPNLPVAEGASILGGHAGTLYHRKDNVFKIDELHKKLGPTFGIYYADIPTVFTTDLDLIRDNVNEEIDHVEHYVLPTEFNVDNIFSADGKNWQRLRRATAPAFTKQKLQNPKNVSDMNELVDRVIDSFHNRIDSAKQNGNSLIFDADEFSSRYSMAVALKCLYRQDNIIDFKAEVDEWVKLVTEHYRESPWTFFSLACAFPKVAPLLYWLCLNLTVEGKIRDKIMSYIDQQARSNAELKRSKEPDASKSKRNLLDYTIDQYHLGKISKREYFHSAHFLFFATNKTTSDTLTTILNSLALHQDVQEKLRKSIEERGAESEYLTWCINETLRLFPPAPIGGTRTLSRDVVTKEGYFLPAKTTVQTSVYTIHRMPEYWGPDANEFKPERWARAKEFHPVQFLSFGAGKRDCLGKHFAMQSLKLLVSSLLRHFRLDRCSETKEITTFEAPYFIFVNFKEPILVKISKLSDKE